jgi:uncharacterized membrane protein
MDIIVLLFVAVFIFAVATLFRSNKALDRVEVVEKELGVLEDEVKEVKEEEIKDKNKIPS